MYVGTRSCIAWVQRDCRPILPSVSAAWPPRTAAESRSSSNFVSRVRGRVRLWRVAVRASPADTGDPRTGLRPLFTGRVCRTGSLPARSARRSASRRVCHSLEGINHLREKIWGSHELKALSHACRFINYSVALVLHFMAFIFALHCFSYFWTILYRTRWNSHGDVVTKSSYAQ